MTYLSNFPITFNTPKQLMKFVGVLLKDDLIREATKIRIERIEQEILESGKKYKCVYPEECTQYKNQGNKATPNCEGCGSLRVTVKQ